MRMIKRGGTGRIEEEEQEELKSRRRRIRRRGKAGRLLD
jgi:hypothetical protein